MNIFRITYSILMGSKNKSKINVYHDNVSIHDSAKASIFPYNV